MDTRQISVEIAAELQRTLGSVEAAQTEALVDAILAADRVFLAGAGRSGFMVRAFAMRLMHMGFTAYVVGEAVTPSAQPGDLLLVLSGSGETGSLVSMANKAKKMGLKLALVSISTQSSIGGLADVVVVIPSPTPKSSVDTGVTSIQPMGSMFEQCALLLFDAAIMRLMEKRGLDAAQMFARHANLE